MKKGCAGSGIEGTGKERARQKGGGESNIFSGRLIFL